MVAWDLLNLIRNVVGHDDGATISFKTSAKTPTEYFP